MKKQLLLVAVITAYAVQTFSQSPNWLWAKSAVGAATDEGLSISTDASGNVYATGYFFSPSLTFGTTTLTNASNGTADIFVVKYDASGNVIWAKSAGGVNSDKGLGVSADASGNVLVTGPFYSPSITFGTTTLVNTDNSGNSADIFVVKYDANGNVLWAKSSGGTSYEYGNSISTDSNGNVLVTGYFDSPSITFGTTTLTNSGSSTDIFIVKYDANGNILWAKSAGGTNLDGGYGVSTDANGNVFVAGIFLSPSINFGSTTLTNVSSGNADIFVVKYDANGNVLWAKKAGGTAYDRVTGISVDVNGNVLITGYFNSSSIAFGTTTLTNIDIMGTTPDIFVVKYDSNGNLIWAKSAGGTGGMSFDEGNAISTDVNGNVLVTGRFGSSSLTFGTTTLTNADNTGNTADIFVVKFNQNGNVVWAKSIGGSNGDIGNSIAADASGNVLVTGPFYSPSITFGTTTLINTVNTGFYSDIFVAKLNSVVGIEELSYNNSLLIIYPNPTSGKCILRLDNSISNAITTIEVFNVLGEMVYSINHSTNTPEVDLSDCPSGVYTLQVKTSQHTFNKKIVIQ
jgi:hypothetical protein